MGHGFESHRDHKRSVILLNAFFMPHTYILYSEKLDKYYVGACIDIDRRLHEHNIGHSKFTVTGVPWIIKHKEYFETLTQVKRREQEIKKKKSRKYIEWLIASTT